METTYEFVYHRWAKPEEETTDLDGVMYQAFGRDHHLWVKYPTARELAHPYTLLVDALEARLNTDQDYAQYIREALDEKNAFEGEVRSVKVFHCKK